MMRRESSTITHFDLSLTVRRSHEMVASLVGGAVANRVFAEGNQRTELNFLVLREFRSGLKPKIENQETLLQITKRVVFKEFGMGMLAE